MRLEQAKSVERGERYARTEKTKKTLRRGSGRCACHCGVSGSAYVSVVLFAQGNAVRYRRSADSAGDLPFKTVRGALHMKVVVVKSPKMFVGFLRLMFGIKKSEMT